MPAYLTLSQRKALETERRRAAVEAMKPELARYGRQNAGRFLIFGSAASGSLRYSSDIDVVSDFAPEVELAAFLFAERLAEEHGIPADIYPLRTLKAEFMERIGPGALVLP